MLTPSYTKQFEKDLKLMMKRGKSAKKIKEIIELLLEQKPLLVRHKDHKLTGNGRARPAHPQPSKAKSRRELGEKILGFRTRHS